MKRFVVVGLGIFGSTIAEALHETGDEVLAVDMAGKAVDRLARHATRAAVGDAREVETLERLGAKDADAAIVSTGDDISASILAVMALQDLGVKDIYVKVISADHARVMKKIGVTLTVFPEHDSANNLANLVTHSKSLLNYIRLGEGFGVQEMAVPAAWEGKPLRDLELRQRFGVSVVAVRDVLTDQIVTIPAPDAELKVSDALLVAGRDEDLARVAGLK
ncbi:MAG: Ktr system potassium uptake protein A [Verrucomicrobiae bacterium]|nr:Ktr system potassium uptake protein A [Verrucomicrobiae bacterium]